MPLWTSLVAVTKAYYTLGLVCLGGPGVHAVISRRRFVPGWVDERTFLDLFALGNALPGPASSQLSMSIAVVAHGLVPGLWAFILWCAPGAVIMGVLGALVARIPASLPPIVLALLTGVNAAAVGLIALAALQMSAAATDSVTTLLLWAAASAGICYHAPWMYPCLIVAGGGVTLLWDFRRVLVTRVRRVLARRGRDARDDAGGGADEDDHGSRAAAAAVEEIELGEPQVVVFDDDSTLRPRVGAAAAAADADAVPSGSTTPTPTPATPHSPLNVVSPPTAAALLLAFVLFLTAPLATRGALQHAHRAVPRALDMLTLPPPQRTLRRTPRRTQFTCNMITAGTIIFGGGPVVIPLLRGYVVEPGWVTSRDFLLLFAISQGIPGPIFNFAVALGVLALPSAPAAGAFLGFVGINAPGILLKLAVLPLYASWRDKAAVRATIRGLNATAAGLVFTAVWQLFLVGYIYVPPTGRPSTTTTATKTTTTQAISGPLTADPFWAVVGSGAFVASRYLDAPPWLSVIGGAGAGLAWFGVRSRP
ncbi:uncharacterized protein LOC62_04G006206 [Vanrija pseudolonga]|uniref:Chromate transporter n=1 Tax=Vanrija pseudolonga TaxID=143232 RepID=A0AAF1BRX2_9TREE|nr:hypothetical protein LOC62_04G006206 [Vanrija pseudolonga]